MLHWEYCKIDLNSHNPKRGDVDLLNAAGQDGWELLAITSNNIAYMKRQRANQGSPGRQSRAKAQA